MRMSLSEILTTTLLVAAYLFVLNTKDVQVGSMAYEREQMVEAIAQMRGQIIKSKAIDDCNQTALDFGPDNKTAVIWYDDIESGVYWCGLSKLEELNDDPEQYTTTLNSGENIRRINSESNKHKGKPGNLPETAKW